MRLRPFSLVSALLLVLLATPAQAQYPPLVPGADFTCAMNSTGTQIFCTVRPGLLEPGTVASIKAIYPLANIQQQSLGAFDADAGAVAFIGAQAATGEANLSATVRPDGGANFQGSLNPPGDTNAPFVATLAGTAPGGGLINTTQTFNQSAEPPAATGETTAATGAESGVLALIALGLVGAGAGAVVLARRRTRVEA